MLPGTTWRTAHYSSNVARINYGTMTFMPTVLTRETPDIASSSEDYACRFSGSAGHYFLEVQSSEVLRLAQAHAAASILDVGGGHAQLTPTLVTHGFDVTVVGSTLDCRERLDRAILPRTFRYVSGDLLDLPFADASFDMVLAFRMLAHLNQWPRFIDELCRVARRAVVVDYPDLRSFNLASRPLFSVKHVVEKNTRPFRCFWRKEVLREFARNGFRAGAVRPQFFFPMALHRLVNCAVVSQLLESPFRWLGLTALFGSPVILCACPEIPPANTGDADCGFPG
jgi:ubiquinone/menaquinone biosynthesis C-methylase UbiE